MSRLQQLLHQSVLCTLFVTMPSIAMTQTKVTIETTLGTIKVLLYEQTPKHRDNFLLLVEKNYYNNLLFHRVISEFMIQTGDPNSRTSRPGQALGDGGPAYTIPSEFNTNYFHKKGALAAARLSDEVNPNRESSGSQFYIVQGKVLSNKQLDYLVKSAHHSPFTDSQRQAYTTIGGSPHLDNAYTVFGEVVEGLNTVDSIASQKTDVRNRPLKDIRIIKAYISE